MSTTEFTSPTMQSAVAGQVERQVRPRAWMGPNGQLMQDEIFTAWAPQYHKDARQYEPLYDQTALDAERASERERCAVVCELIGKDIVCPEECAAAIRGPNVVVTGPRPEGANDE